MRRHWISRILKFGVIGLLFFGLFTFLVMSLWNWLMPPLFGVHVISFWQALGILVLSKILFGGFRGGPHRRGWNWRRRMFERWEQMTPEEREKFREGMRHRCGPFGAEPANPKV
jgi:Ca2+/H+ antiporter, TMEM165/GDT1 family